MSLRQQGPRALVSQRRDRMVRDMEAKLEEAFAAATRDLLRRALAEVEVVRLTAAVEQTVRVFSAGEAAAWWREALDERVSATVTSVWRSGYFDTRDGGLTPRARRDAAEFTEQTLRRMAEGANAPPQRIYETTRRALDSDLSAGRTLNEAVGRAKAELSWNEPTEFWQGRLNEANTRIDQVLDPIGPPGDPAREAARKTDPQIRALQQQRAEAVKHVEREKSTWRVQSEELSRREATATYNQGSIEAAEDEDAGVKVWVATPDDITRDTHLEASGQCTPVEDTFTVGVDLLAYPGDESGSAEEVYNCRCTLVFATDCDEAEQLYGDVYSMIDDEQQRRQDEREAEEPTT